ncbi:MAG TPA: HAMP domain-containing sensor histidine kinase [Pseudomonadales bacterium]
MTPEAVIYRYLEAAHGQPLSVEGFVRVLSADADLLGRWLTLTNATAEPDALVSAITAMSREETVNLAQAQAWAVLPAAGSARLGLDQWQSVLRSSFLAEVLAEQMGLEDPVTVRWRILLAISGVTLPQDEPLMELAAFRGVSAQYLGDAGALVRIFGVVDAFEIVDQFEAAQIAEALLGVDSKRFPELVEWAGSRCSDLVRSLELSDPDADWSNRLWVQQQVAMLSALLPLAENHHELQSAHEFITRSLFRQVPLLLFEVTAGCYQSLVVPDVQIHVDSPTSLIAEAIRAGTTQGIIDRSDLSVGDRQLLRRLGALEGQCVPVRGNGHSHAALLMVVDEDMDCDFALELYAEALAQRLGSLGAKSSELDVLKRYRQREEKRLREIVHEANNPLSVVQNYLHILQMRLQHEASAAEQLDMIGTELARAAQIIQRARELPPLMEVDSEPQVQFDEFDVNGLARRVYELHLGYAADHNVDLKLRAHAGILIIESDQQRLAQILNNLVRNAIEAAGGERVSIGTETGVFREGREGVEVSVSDTGPGLPRAVLERLAEPKDSTKGGDHAGLGLHIVHRLVHELGGNIDVRTASGQGTTFSLFLPLNR